MSKDAQDAQGVKDAKGAKGARAEANLALVRRFFEYYATDNVTALRDDVLAADAVWRVAGRHPLAGDHRGAEAIVDFYRALAAADLHVEPLFFEANADWAVEVHRMRSEGADGPALDTSWVLTFRITDGRISEVRYTATDQEAADSFFRALLAAA
ncbi:nuclear transport factor 2 family protein [Streptomyces sp. NPDC059009]|uniref:nuclear transport factor 2 family protein n=1 Tax=Streptomyces sp. NPDC059009 TaxID=3346694 RepID=UPI0036A2546E